MNKLALVFDTGINGSISFDSRKEKYHLLHTSTSQITWNRSKDYVEVTYAFNPKHHSHFQSGIARLFIQYSTNYDVLSHLAYVFLFPGYLDTRIFHQTKNAPTTQFFCGIMEFFQHAPLFFSSLYLDRLSCLGYQRWDFSTICRKLEFFKWAPLAIAIDRIPCKINIKAKIWGTKSWFMQHRNI